ncbi:MFS family transporter: glycerol-3-phosphate [Thraustotheca clavata]|uniref:MFS family transporter: glycerol-3-phosphate n=1 Tax=Thraustotheca clavata TaxID=74557 RepID=A0A1V9YX16_9STRA|nr:MFS family transporter: glycerol-3-phosphate [Thraustotheca clavata]
MNQRDVFALTYAAYIAVYFTRKPFSVAKSTLTTTGAHSESELGLIDTAFLIAYAAGQFGSGFIALSVGVKVGLTISYIGTGICAFFFGFSQSKDVRAIAWFLNGIFQAQFFPFIMEVLGAWFPPSSRGQIMGLWTSCQQVGGFATSSFGAYVLSNPNMTWRDVFILPSYLSFLFAFITLAVLQPAPPKLPAKASSEDKENKSSKPAPKSFMATLSVPFLFNISSAYFFIKLVRYTYLGWLPYYMTSVLGFSAAESVLMSSVFDLAGTIGSVVCGFVSDKLFGGHSAKVIAPMCLLCGMFTIVYPQVAAISSTCNLLIMGAVGLFVAGPDSMLGGAACAEICGRANQPSAATMATGIANGMGSLGAIASGLLPILIKDHFGWTMLFNTLGGLAILGGVLLLPMLKSPVKTKDA